MRCACGGKADRGKNDGRAQSAGKFHGRSPLAVGISAADGRLEPERRAGCAADDSTEPVGGDRHTTIKERKWPDRGTEAEKSRSTP
jgi:hypothetical protein